MKYLKVFVDFAEKIELLGDGERGRLFTAMLEYAKTGTEPELKGNERFIWATAKSEIDRQAESYERICKINKKIATERNEALRSVAERNGALQEQEQDKEQEQEQEELNTSAAADVSPTGVGRGDVQTVIDAWNSLGLNPIRGIMPNTTRRQLLNGRLSQYGLSTVLQAIENVRSSAFLNGQNNRGFTATFDWVVKPTNFQKVLDGNYNDRRNPSAKSTADRLSQMIEEGAFGD